MTPFSPGAGGDPKRFAGPRKDVRDEAFGERFGDGNQYAPVISELESAGRLTLHRRQQLLDRISAELGTHFAVIDDQLIDEERWRLDPFPRILDFSEWQHLERGLIQRASAFNAFVGDIYGEQRILADDIVPYDYVYADPTYYRPLRGIPVPLDRFVVFGAVDLVRDSGGRWRVMENHYSAPFGLSYVLQVRRMLAQAYPELFHSVTVSPVASFTARMAEILRESSPRRPGSLMVLLSRGDNNLVYFEESFLARHMGIPLVKSGDLLVRGSCVFLKRVDGLARVDVIYRRVETGSLDPVGLASPESHGVPGLLHCVRRGNVAVVNALGSGVADNRAILRFSDAIIRYYLNEDPILPTVPTFACRDPDQANEVASRPDDFVLKPVVDRNTLRILEPDLFRDGGPDAIKVMLRKRPDLVVAQSRVEPSRCPVLENGKFVSRDVYLRAFVALGNQPAVLPGGLTRVGTERSGRIRLSIMAGGLKDTWIIGAPRPSAEAPAAPAPEEDAEADYAPGSRVAESLYWLGRYLERAESTARMLNVLESVRWDELSQEDRRGHWPLWKAFANAIGDRKLLASRRIPTRLAPTVRELVIDPDRAGSVAGCLRSALVNAREVRESVSPELAIAVEGLETRFRERTVSRRIRRDAYREICQEVIDGVARIVGLGERTLVHDETWQILRIGQHMERAQITAAVLESALDQALTLHERHLEDETDLTALLRLVAALDAYRREYRSRAYLDRVGRLLWTNPQCPSSIAYCVRQIAAAIDAVQADEPRSRGTRLRERVAEVGAEIEQGLSTGLFSPRVAALDRDPGTELPALRKQRQRLHAEISALRESLEGLHQQLEDAWFNHLEEFSED